MKLTKPTHPPEVFDLVFISHDMGSLWWVNGCTLPKINSSPLKIGRNPKGKESSNHPFSGATILEVNRPVPFSYRLLKGGDVPRGGGNWGTLRWIPLIHVIAIGKSPIAPIPIGSMGRLVYLPTNLP